MNQLHFLKNMPAPVRMLIRPMLYVSLSLHGLFLLLPIASNPSSESLAEAPEERVAIRQLTPSPPPSPTVQTPATTPSPPPSPPVQTPPPRPSPAPVSSPSPTLRRPSPRPSPPSPPPAEIVPEPTPTPQVEETPDPFLGQELFETPEPTPSPEVVQTPEPTPSPEVVQTPEPTPSPEVAQTPEPTPSPEVVQTPEPTPSPEVVQTPEPTPAFPQVIGAQHGCNNNIVFCWKAEGQRATAVARSLQASLEAQGFSFTRVDGDRTGERIYEVSKDGEIHYYISLSSTLDGGTQYAITEEPLSIEELQNQGETELQN